MSAGEAGPGWIRDPGTPYEVSRSKIAEFADAIGDPNPVYRDAAAARRAGYPDVIAPPTFAVVVVLPSCTAAVREAAQASGAAAVVHVDQHFQLERPIRAADILHVRTAVTGTRELRGTALVTTRAEVRSADGEHICTAALTLALLPPDGPAPA